MPTYRIVLGNIILCIGHLIDFIAGFKYNDKKTVTKISIGTSLCSTLSNLVLGAYGGAVSCTITVARQGVIYYKDKYHKRMTLVFIALCILYLSSLFDWRGWYSICVVLSVFCAFLPKWFSMNVQYLRIGGLLANLIYIPYYILIKAYTGVLISVFNSITISINIVKWWLVNRKNKGVVVE